MNETKLLGNGEGHTVLILTDSESRLIRKYLTPAVQGQEDEQLRAFNRGIHRGTERIKAEFDAEQKARKNK